MRKIKKLKLILFPFALVLITFLYNEYLIYWQVLLKCNWPEPHTSTRADSQNKLYNIMLIADTHLLGSRHGHWFDKLRREWQQHRQFQTARQILHPDLIVILGDLTDEGKWCSDREVLYSILIKIS